MPPSQSSSPAGPSGCEHPTRSYFADDECWRCDTCGTPLPSGELPPGADFLTLIARNPQLAAKAHREAMVEVERLRELLHDARALTGMAYSDPPAPDDIAARIDAYFDALDDA